MYQLADETKFTYQKNRRINEKRTNQRNTVFTCNYSATRARERKLQGCVLFKFQIT